MNSNAMDSGAVNPGILKRVMIAPVIVGALGYFVDIYDLVLFSIVRVASLKSLGLEGEELLTQGVFLINMQMAGMLLGGILWGILGDKKGRISVLFGSIFLYSAANILNAFVTDVTQYGILRFIAGVGLAGELGAAITLVSEVLPKEIRGYGTSIVASVGICGAVLAGIIGEKFSWQTAYIVGGVLGLLLLVTRIQLRESGMFDECKMASEGAKPVSRGNIFLLFQSRERFWKYLQCIGVGIPIWYVIGILVTFSPEITRELGITGEVTGGKAILFTYVGLAIGDLTSGLMSQWMASRKRAVWIYLGLTIATVALYLVSRGITPGAFYFLCIVMGVGVGYWALFVTISAEQFGTNLRATVTTSVPNFVRGSVVPLTLAFGSLRESAGLVGSAAWVGVGVFLISLLSLVKLEESFHRDLNFLELERS